MQRLLAANSGFSWQDFAEFLSTIISRRLDSALQLQQQQHEQQQDEAHKHSLQRCAMTQQQQQQGANHQPVAGGADASAAGDLPAGAVSCAMEQHATTESVQLQLQLMHCAFDLQRAAAVLQQVQQAFAEATAHNAAWCERHSSSGRNSQRLLAGKQCVQPAVAVSSCCSMPTRQSVDDTCITALPAWVQEAGRLVQSAMGVAGQLKQLCVPLGGTADA